MQADAGDAAALVAELRASSSSAEVQAGCCAALSGLTLEGDAAADAVDAIMAALRHGVDHAALQHIGFRALSKLLRDNKAIRVSAAAAGAVEALVAGLRAHPGDAGVQAQGCAVLGDIAADSAHVSATAGAAGAVQVIMTALRRHIDDDVQYYGWMALGSITADDAGNAASAGAAGAVKEAVTALKRRPAAPSVLSGASLALGAMTGYCPDRYCPDRAAEAGAAGAVKAIVAALGAFPDDVRLQCNGCATLAGLRALCTWQTTANAHSAVAPARPSLRACARSPQKRECRQPVAVRFVAYFYEDTNASKHAQLAADASITVVAAMKAHASVGDLQRKACDALSNIATLNRTCQAAAGAAGGIEASVAALRAHAVDASMQKAGCDALGNICAHMPGHQAKAVAAGGIEAIIQALRRHAADAEVQRAGCTALANMVQNSRSSVQRANAAGALDAIVATATGPAAAITGVFDAVCCALHELVPGHEAAAVCAGALEALEQRTATDDGNEALRRRLIQLLQPAAHQHDARPCTHAGCKRCAAARARGAMCALAGCGIRRREGGKRLQRCITCRTARYCSEAHQLDDWQRHKPECFAERDRQAGTSGGASE
jgi:hypothetical protein